MSATRRGGIAGRCALVCAGLVATINSGCLERTITVTSEPTGAEAFVNDTYIGRTPATTDFLFYGTYDVRVRKDGFEAMSGGREAAMPWYAVPPVDLLASGIPVPIKTERHWHVELKPETSMDDAAAREAIVERARALRASQP